MTLINMRVVAEYQWNFDPDPARLIGLGSSEAPFHLGIGSKIYTLQGQIIVGKRMLETRIQHVR